METLEKRDPRLLIPVIIFLATGFTVTFTQGLHEDLRFNSWLIVVFGLALGLTSFINWTKTKKEPAGFVPALSGVLSLALAVVAISATNLMQLRLGLLLWAAINVAVYAYAWMITKNSKALLVAAYGTFFVLVIAFVATDLPAVVGFFAAFCIMAGVYLGIAAFDPKETDSKETRAQESQHETGISI